MKTDGNFRTAYILIFNVSRLSACFRHSSDERKSDETQTLDSRSHVKALKQKNCKHKATTTTNVKKSLQSLILLFNRKHAQCRRLSCGYRCFDVSVTALIVNLTRKYTGAKMTVFKIYQYIAYICKSMKGKNLFFFFFSLTTF